jgi:hypothetical protein
MYIYLQSYIPSLLRAVIPTHVDIRACACSHVRTHMRARIGGAAAHNGRRHIDDPPSASRSGGVRPGRKGGAYIGQKGDTRGVPRADVRVERRRTVERLRAEPPAVDADETRSHVSRRMRGRPIAHAPTRVRTDAARGRVCAAGPHRRSVRRCSQARMDVDTCMHHVYICYTRACSIDGATKRARPHSHKHTCRV